jgi:hypothetical protein
MLEAEHVGTDHLSDRPVIKPTIEMSSNRKRENDDASKSETVPNIVGFVAVKDEEEEEDLNSNQEESDGEGNEEVI